MGSADSGDESDTEDMVVVQVALENAQQQLWETFDDFFQEEQLPSESEVTEVVENVFWELREQIAQVVEARASSSSSSGSSASSASEDQWGVVLPIARRRRGDGRAP